MSTPISGTGLPNAQAADTELTAEIATYIADVATRLQTAINSGSDTAMQAIADDLTADAATLRAADPLAAPTTNVPIAGPNAPAS